MDRILVEQSFQSSGCTDSECAVKMGKLLNVQKMIIGSLTKFGNYYYISASVIDVETGKIDCSEKVACKTQKDSPDRAEDLAVLVAEKMTNKRSESKEYFRRKISKNSLRANAGSFIFYGDVRNIEASAMNYSLSYRRQGVPYLKQYDAYTEIEAGYFVVARDSSKINTIDHKIEYYPVTINMHYYLPLPSVFEVYAKVGGGASYGKSTIASNILETSVTDTSIDPLLKAGLGLDILGNNKIGFQIEVLYNYYSMQGSSLSGLTVNGGISYNW